jgi:hypothetical protein
MMVAAGTSETSVNLYQTTRRNIPENSHLRTRRRENLKNLTLKISYRAQKNPLLGPVLSQFNCVYAFHELKRKQVR